ncbi:MAG TPA: hypothetical protein H9779_02515 [Candidatus Alistipes avicola]|uniref:Lipocalin-like domain-containing protein n=1 Tax=Candidatus Alistipes avicola TaxID=2838432 RepID=A0A9D2IE85_9BACT|nr:hypothetical protein [uncultured Alistipes sp.]HJA98458.1 hypothetical protein [Candidatus Alistipes avicola]
MKTLRLFLLAMAFIGLAACSNDDTPAPQGELPDGYTFAQENDQLVDGRMTGNLLFFGTSTVTTIKTGEQFVDDKILFELTEDENGIIRMLMHETKFAANMPALEMEVPGIPYTCEGKTLHMSVEQTIPEIAGTPYERYVITELGGEVDNTSFTVTFSCMGAFKVVYQGKLIVKAA